MVAQLVRALVSQAESWVYESGLRQTKVFKAGSVSPTDKRLATDVNVNNPHDAFTNMPRFTGSVARLRPSLLDIRK